MSSLFSIIEKLIIPLLGAALGAIATVIMNERRNNEKIVKYKKEVVANARQLGFCLAKLKSSTNKKRALILKIENGDIRDLSTTKFVSIIDEIIDHTFVPSFNIFQQYQLDEAYKNLLKKLLNKEILYLNVDQMEDGFLKRYYQVSGIKSSIVFPIKEIKNRLVFGSIANDTLDELTDSDISSIEIFQHNAAKMIELYPEICD